MTACPECGIDDALGRHDWSCPHAIAIDLPRLAEGEDPITPITPGEEEAVDGPPEMPPDEPGNIQRAPDEDHVARQRPDGRWEAAPRSQNPDAGLYTGLWIAYGNHRDSGFDAIVFTSEIDALRHAVRTGQHVHPLEFGRSLREQLDETE